MEDTQNNQPPTQQAPAPEPVVTQPSPTTQPTPPVNPQSKSSKNTFIIVFLIILALITAALFFLTSNRQKPTPAQAPVMIVPTQAAAPSPTVGSLEEQEVEQVDITDTSPTDFPQVEKEIEQL